MISVEPPFQWSARDFIDFLRQTTLYKWIAMDKQH